VSIRPEDRALLDALQARSTASSTDQDAISLRQIARSGVLSPAALRGVWGRLEAGRPGFGPVVAHGAAAAVLAADRWGGALSFAPTPLDALAMAQRGGRAVIGLSGQPWWGRLLVERGLRVVGALPDDAGGLPQALVVGGVATEPSGDDRTFWVTDAPGPASGVIERLSHQGLAADILESAGGLKLFMIAGYVQVEDGRLDAPGLGSLTGVIGAAPLF
jgi:hypothetical protein